MDSDGKNPRAPKPDERADDASSRRAFLRRALSSAIFGAGAIALWNCTARKAEAVTLHEDFPHIDVNVNKDHTDSPHQDSAHTDVPFIDIPAGEDPTISPYIDSPHSDVPLVNIPAVNIPAHSDHFDEPHEDITIV